MNLAVGFGLDPGDVFDEVIRDVSVATRFARRQAVSRSPTTTEF
jgi:hypothetical protein